MEGAGQLVRKVCPACNARYDDGGGFCAKDGTPLVKDQNAGKDNMVGQVLADRYRIVKLIGEGGMGQVYEAQHVNINKRFAIKLLRPEIVSNPEAVQRFRQEAWSASSIGHDNIIEIDDFATLPNGSVYLAMEYLAGESLAERMKQPPPLETGQALDIFAQVTRGLAAAHEKAIIHRDMKPENIYLASKHGRTVVKILDFGIAKVSGAEGSQSLTRTGAIFGTPHYMSPEQALGKPLDHRSDIYSVGVIMYEVFTGRVPFEAESFMGILTKHITSEPRRPTEVAPDRMIPVEIESVIMRAMAKDANERYPSMGELTNDLLVLMHEFAPSLLTPSGSQPLLPSRTPSQPMSAQPGSGAFRVSQPTPVGLRKHSGAGPSTPQTGAMASSQPGLAPQPGGFPSTDNVDPIPFDGPIAKKSSLGILLAIGGVLVIGGAAIAFVMIKKTPDPVPQVKTTDPAPIVNPPPVVAPPPAVAPTLVVIVDSLPPGAKILKEGVQIGETPEEVKVAQGATVSVVLHKDGFIDESVVLDPSKGHKLMVKLDRPHGSSSHTPKAPVYSRLPAPPPVPVSSPPTTAPKSPPPKQRKPVDPYERLDDAPSKKADVLNPY